MPCYLSLFLFPSNSLSLSLSLTHTRAHTHTHTHTHTHMHNRNSGKFTFLCCCNINKFLSWLLHSKKICHALVYKHSHTHMDIIYNKPRRCNSGSIAFINNCGYALHVSDALCVHHQEHYKL